MTEDPRNADDSSNHQFNREFNRLVQSVYHTGIAEQPFPTHPFPIWRNLGSALGGIRTLPENLRFFRRPILVIEPHPKTQKDICAVLLAAHNYGKSPIIEFRGRATVELPTVEGMRKGEEPESFEGRSTSELGWAVLEGASLKNVSNERIIDLYPEPDRTSAALFGAGSTGEGFAISLFHESAPVFAAQHDVVFFYPDQNLRTRDLLAIFNCWVGGKTQTGGYKTDSQIFVVVVPNFGKFNECDLTKLRVIPLTLKSSRSKLRELFQGLSPIASSSERTSG